MNKVYFSSLESSCLEVVESEKMKPIFINEKDGCYRLSIQRDEQSAFVSYLSGTDLKRLLTSLNEVVLLGRESVYKIKNKVVKTDLYKYSDKKISKSHTRYLKLEMIPKHNVGDSDKVAAVVFTPSIYYRRFLLPIKARNFQTKPFIINREEAIYLISYIEMILDDYEN